MLAVSPCRRGSLIHLVACKKHHIRFVFFQVCHQIDMGINDSPIPGIPLSIHSVPKAASRIDDLLHTAHRYHHQLILIHGIFFDDSFQGILFFLAALQHIFHTEWDIPFMVPVFDPEGSCIGWMKKRGCRCMLPSLRAPDIQIGLLVFQLGQRHKLHGQLQSATTQGVQGRDHRAQVSVREMLQFRAGNPPVLKGKAVFALLCIPPVGNKGHISHKSVRGQILNGQTG